MGDPLKAEDAYWIYSVKPDTEKRVVRVSKMTPDWTALTGFSAISSTIAEPDEAPAAFHAAGRYYVWTSHCSGWASNAAILHQSAGLTGNWTDSGNPTGNKTSFSSQSTYILPLDDGDIGSLKMHAGVSRFIYVADRFE